MYSLRTINVASRVYIYTVRTVNVASRIYVSILSELLL